MLVILARQGFGQFTVALTGSDHNGYGVSCFGDDDGWVNATVTGGTAPYQYRWSNGATTQNVSGLVAGYYRLSVLDADSVMVEADITLTTPKRLVVEADPYRYPNGHNISCHECFNGSIDVIVQAGVAPYSFTWEDGPVTEDRTGLGAGSYRVVVYDANGCGQRSNIMTLTQPDRSDWRMNGNTGTDPNSNYLGTADAQDLVLRSNATERLRLKADGNVVINGTGIASGFLYRTGNGELRGGGLEEVLQLMPVDPCALLSSYPVWLTKGNDFSLLCEEQYPKLGTLNADPLKIITNDQTRISVMGNGRVAIGAEGGTDQLEVHTTLEKGGISLVNNTTEANKHTEIRFRKGQTQNWALGCDIEANGGQNFFIWDQPAESIRFLIDEHGRVALGGAQFGGDPSLYRLYVEGGIVARDLKVMAGVFPDYVFKPGYILRSFDEIRSFIQEHGHLPGIPSEAEVAKNGGYEVGDLQLKMLRVIEEQQLYIMQLEERLRSVEAKVQH